MDTLINCLNCGKEKIVDACTWTNSTRKGKNVGRFCNNKCSGDFKSKNTPPKVANTQCLMCNVPIYRNVFRLKRRTFCDKQCKDTYNKLYPDNPGRGGLPLQKKCLECGILFVVLPYKFEKQKFCSTKCGHASRTTAARTAGYLTTETKRFYTSTAWKKLRLVVLQRDSYTCKDCNQVGGVLGN